MKRTLVSSSDILVVLIVIVFSVCILMPAGAMVRQGASRILCETNLSTIGKAMALYANDFEGSFPVAGGPEARWGNRGHIREWHATETCCNFTLEQEAYGRPGINKVTISCSLYLLVKYQQLHPRQFICRGDGAQALRSFFDFEFADLWDFGHDPGSHCSYSYHMSYFTPDRDPGFPLTAGSDPGSPVCADRNPYLDRITTRTREYLESDFDGDGPNSSPHFFEGQNVLFADTHVDFVTSPYVGIGENNIWVYGDDGEGEAGTAPEGMGDGAPADFSDAYLVNETQ